MGQAPPSAFSQQPFWQIHPRPRAAVHSAVVTQEPYVHSTVEVVVGAAVVVVVGKVDVVVLVGSGTVISTATSPPMFVPSKIASTYMPV